MTKRIRTPDWWECEAIDECDSCHYIEEVCTLPNDPDDWRFCAKCAARFEPQRLREERLREERLWG